MLVSTPAPVNPRTLPSPGPAATHSSAQETAVDREEEESRFAFRACRGHCAPGDLREELDDSERQCRVRDHDADRDLEHVLLRRKAVRSRVHGITHGPCERFRLVALEARGFEVFRRAQGIERRVHAPMIAQAHPSRTAGRQACACAAPPTAAAPGHHDAAHAARRLDIAK